MCSCEGCKRGTTCVREGSDNHALEIDGTCVVLASESVADEAIGLFLEYRDGYSYGEDEARRMVLAEFAEASCLVRPNSTLINAAKEVTNYKDINDLSQKIGALRSALLNASKPRE